MSIQKTRAAYDQYADREWSQLESGAQHRLEYLVTMHALRRHLPPAGSGVNILDAGGGPGRYTIALAEMGYHVTLLDLSPRLLDIAKRRIAELPSSVQSRIGGITEGSITDLSQFPEGAFDATLCLGGPASHLLEQSDRQRAFAELRCVTRSSGMVFVSVMGRIGQYRSVVQWPDWFDGVFPRIAETGSAHITPERAPCYFFYPEELSRELTQAGLEVDRLYGCQGIGAHLDEANRLTLMDDPVRWPQWERKLLETCDHHAIVGVSNHILAVSRHLR